MQDPKQKVFLFSSNNEDHIAKLAQPFSGSTSPVIFEDLTQLDKNNISSFASFASDVPKNLSKEETNKLIIESLKLGSKTDETTETQIQTQTHSNLYEVNQIALTPSNYGSWLIKNNVVSNSNLLLVTPFDPRFYLLPFLYKEKKNFQSLDQIFISNELFQLKSFTVDDALIKFKLDAICDLKNFNTDCKDLTNFDSSSLFFRFNEEKFLVFIREKVSRVKKVMKKIRERVAKTTESFLNLPSSNQASEEDEEEDLYRALEIIIDYLPVELQEVVSKDFSYTVDEFYAKKRKQSSLAEAVAPPLKKAVETKQEKKAEAKSSFLADFMNETGAVPPPKIIKIDKKAENAAKGTKKIAGFFTKK